VNDGSASPQREATAPEAAAPAPVAPGREHWPVNLRARAEGLNFFYGKHQALKGINLPVADRRVTALIGPSGCGKSTFLRCFNRMHDLQADTRYGGSIHLRPDNINLVAADVDPIEVRMRISLVFQ